MAIYHCAIRSIGKSTHLPNTSSAHIKYITRSRALSAFVSHHMPQSVKDARTWIRQQEKSDRKNGRIIDKICVALPRELTAEQQQNLIKSYVEALTHNRIPYLYAIHSKGADANNPHAHIVLRDRDLKTGKRYLCLSDSKRDWKSKNRPENSPVEWVRKVWEDEANKALEIAGHDSRIDRRTLEEQRDEAFNLGDYDRAEELNRTPQIHVGAKVHAMSEKGIEPQSQERPEKKHYRQKYRDKTPYPNIDKGKTRLEYNNEIVKNNLLQKVIWGYWEMNQCFRGMFNFVSKTWKHAEGFKSQLGKSSYLKNMIWRS